MIYRVIYANHFEKDRVYKKLQMSSHYLLDDPRISITNRINRVLNKIVVTISHSLLIYEFICNDCNDVNIVCICFVE